MSIEGLSQAVIAHVSGLTIGQGFGVGERFRVMPWQGEFIRGLTGATTSALTLARGGGKTTLIAGLADAYLRGPLRQPAGEVTVVASSFKQARRTFAHVVRFLEAAGVRDQFRVLDNTTSAMARCRSTGARIEVLGHDPGRLQGLASACIIGDELADWPAAQVDRMLAAITTSLGKIPDSKFMAIGTRPATADHAFERLLEGGADYLQIHKAEEGDDLGALETWIKANPSLPFFPHLLEAYRGDWRKAQKDPSLMASFKALRLNLGVSMVVEALLLDAGVWTQLEGARAARSGAYVLGLDLGGSAAMSAAAGYWPSTGLLLALAAFPRLPSLAERGLSDGVGRLYSAMAERGEMLVLGERYSDVAGLLSAVVERWGRPAAIVADRWREAELREVLDKAGFPQTALLFRGQGFKDGAEDVRRFRKACLELAVVAPESLLLRSAIGEARVVSDPAGNSKLAKQSQGGRRARARDDAAAAAILAVAEGRRQSEGRLAPGRMVPAVVVG